MLKTAVILSLAVAALAVQDNVPEQVIRFGSVGTTFADLVGVLTPVNPVLYKGIPAYDFVRVVDGVPAVETDKHYFRCNVMNNFYVPHADSPKPVLLCRNEAFEKATTVGSSADKIAFLFSAENLVVPTGVSEIELQFGKNLWKSFVEAHAAAFASPVTNDDSGAVRTVVNPFDSMLTYDDAIGRVKRQWGGGFGGAASNAQASSQSFGGGGGFGGLGGGFGGSASQASAGSIAGGGGGGGPFFG